MSIRTFKEITLFNLDANSAPIKCAACGEIALPKTHADHVFEQRKLTGRRSAKREMFFGQSICANCNRFWDMSLKTRKHADVKAWQFAEAKVHEFFQRRNIPAARTIGRGPDVMVMLFGMTLKIEVKSGWYTGDELCANLPTQRRQHDDIAVVVTPDQKMLWFEMTDYLNRKSGERFVMSRGLIAERRGWFFLEAVISRLSEKREKYIGSFRILNPIEWRTK